MAASEAKGFEDSKSRRLNEEMQNTRQARAVGNDDGSVHVRMACSLCRRRKMRCNRLLPCDSCTRLGFECIYEAPKAQVTRRQRTVKTEVNPYTVASTDDGSSRAAAYISAGSNTKKVLQPSTSRIEWKPDHMSKELMAELEHQYFETVHHSISLMHRTRYTASTTAEPRLRPPSYLRQIICALGAMALPQYASMHNALYHSAKRQLEDAEMNDESMTSISIARPQTWILLAVYELLQMQFHRWWVSTTRSVCLVQMMGLHMIDGVRPLKRCHPVAKDWADAEEQRRTFWAAFWLDRYAAFNQGCPMIIDERDIRTHLPVSEESFESSSETRSMTLNEAFKVRDMATLPAAVAGILIAAETGQKLKLLVQDGFDAHDRHPGSDLWQKISWLDETLHYAFSVPPHLASSGFTHTPILTFLHMCAPTSTIILHEAAEEQASAHGVTPSSLLESQALRLAAAEMVASTMRLASHVDIRLMHPFTGVCLFSASKVLMRSLAVRIDQHKMQSLQVLLTALGKLQAANPLTGGYFKDLDAEFPGMRSACMQQLLLQPSDPVGPNSLYPSPVEISQRPPYLQEVVSDYSESPAHSTDGMAEDQYWHPPENSHPNSSHPIPNQISFTNHDFFGP